MPRFDSHIHCWETDANPQKLLENLAAAGLDGGSVFSPLPESPVRHGTSYEDRMNCLEKWMPGTEGRLFPFLWIHPFEHDAIDKARDAVQRGVAGFKMTCDCYYVYDPQAMSLLREIAKLGKPVIFHSGIHWGAIDSSKFNRPVNWEAMLTIPNLRFSLAHCSWPWTDECIAVYGKFLNAYTSNPDASAEMFLDTTPGTPVIYRRDLITKLLMSGYDTPHNLLYGTDGSANEYNPLWAKEWIDRDAGIMRELGASERVIDHYLGENYLRFLGLTEKNFEHVMPIPDRPGAWSLEYANQTM